MSEDFDLADKVAGPTSVVEGRFCHFESEWLVSTECDPDL